MRPLQRWSVEQGAGRRGGFLGRAIWPFAALAAALAVLPWLGVSAYVLGVLTLAFYLGVFAMAWDLLFGYLGEVNFGPTFLVGLGAYGAALLNNYTGLALWGCLAGGAAAAVVGGLLLALPALRLRGPYFGLVTLAAVLFLQRVIVIAARYTGGEIGLAVPSVLSLSARVNYYYALGFMLLSGAVLLALVNSPLGLILQAIGQDAMDAAVLGFNVTKYKLAAFCLSALFSGLAGGLTIFYLGTVSVGTVVDIAVTLQIIIAAILGGRRTIIGAVLGALFLIVMGEYLRPLGDLNEFVVAALALGVLLWAPDGLLGFVVGSRRVEG